MEETMEMEVDSNSEKTTNITNGGNSGNVATVTSENSIVQERNVLSDVATSSGQNVERMQVSTEHNQNLSPSTSEDLSKNNNMTDDTETVDPDSPDGVYMDKDELIQSILNEPYIPPPVFTLRTQPAYSDHSDFESSDDRDDFELWSSDSSIRASSDEQDQEMDVDEETVAKRKKQCESIDLWEDIKKEKIQKFEFTGKPHTCQNNFGDKITPLHCFKLFVTDDIINMLVTETNKFARSKFIRPGYHKDFLTGWMDVTPTEMLEFIGLLIFMNCRRLPGTRYYWSGERDLSAPTAGYIMTETRFKRLLTFWHFGDDNGEEYSKIRNLLNMLNENFEKYKEPGRIVYVGKTTMYLRERYAVQDKSKENPKKGQKLLRLLDNEAYTYRVVVLPSGKSEDRNIKKKGAVLNLLHNYLYEGRLFIFYNLFVSVDIAQELLKRKSYVVGPLRKKAKGTPAKILKLKISHNQLKGFQNSDGISLFKWKTDELRGCGLSSYHSTDIVQVEEHDRREGKVIVKQQSEFLRDYSSSVDVFDLVEKYGGSESPLNHETTWYRRVANDLLTSTCVANAYYMYKTLSTDKNYQYYKFQDHLWKELAGFTWLLQGENSAEQG